MTPTVTLWILVLTVNNAGIDTSLRFRTEEACNAAVVTLQTIPNNNFSIATCVQIADLVRRT
jgi:hypothetical protein